MNSTDRARQHAEERAAHYRRELEYGRDPNSTASPSLFALRERDLETWARRAEEEGR